MPKPYHTPKSERDAALNTQADRDAAWGNERVTRGAWIREEVRQTGCLAIEAAKRWEAGER